MISLKKTINHKFDKMYEVILSIESQIIFVNQLYIKFISSNVEFECQ